MKLSTKNIFKDLVGDKKKDEIEEKELKELKENKNELEEFFLTALGTTKEEAAKLIDPKRKVKIVKVFKDKDLRLDSDNDSFANTNPNELVYITTETKIKGKVVVQVEDDENGTELADIGDEIKEYIDTKGNGPLDFITKESTTVKFNEVYAGRLGGFYAQQHHNHICEDCRKKLGIQNDDED